MGQQLEKTGGAEKAVGWQKSRQEFCFGDFCFLFLLKAVQMSTSYTSNQKINPINFKPRCII